AHREGTGDGHQQASPRSAAHRINAKTSVLGEHDESDDNESDERANEQGEHEKDLLFASFEEIGPLARRCLPPEGCADAFRDFGHVLWIPGCRHYGVRTSSVTRPPGNRNRNCKGRSRRRSSSRWRARALSRSSRDTSPRNFPVARSTTGMRVKPRSAMR